MVKSDSFFRFTHHFWKTEVMMRLNAPTKIVWIIALILGLLGILGALTDIPIVSEYNFWFVVVGWLLLIIATVAKGF
jgi:hypothetical protein